MTGVECPRRRPLRLPGYDDTQAGAYGETRTNPCAYLADKPAVPLQAGVALTTTSGYNGRRVIAQEEKMAEKTLSLEELRHRPIDQVLQEIAETGDSLLVLLPEGRVIRITPLPSLRPLPVLEGSVPEGWKNALYGSTTR